MKKFILFTILLCFSVSISTAQKPKTAATPINPKLIQPTTVTEISGAEWTILIDALQAENWKTAALVASQYLEKLKTDNDKKQLAQLRYFYLYALAGKILAASTSKIPVEKSSLWRELDTAVGNFIGKEFILPPRQFLPECKAVLNYICAVKDNDRLLRVTATNKEGVMIHSFDYVTFDEKISWGELIENQAFLGGKLKRAEFNQDMSKPWVMRLIFDKGFIRVVVTDNK
jgi:hypothetical protein